MAAAVAATARSSRLGTLGHSAKTCTPARCLRCRNRQSLAGTYRDCRSLSISAFMFMCIVWVCMHSCSSAFVRGCACVLGHNRLAPEHPGPHEVLSHTVHREDVIAAATGAVGGFVVCVAAMAAVVTLRRRRAASARRRAAAGARAVVLPSVPALSIVAPYITGSVPAGSLPLRATIAPQASRSVGFMSPVGRRGVGRQAQGARATPSPNVQSALVVAVDGMDV
jgi:hypothetical protein